MLQQKNYINIPIELVPFIVEALYITEQELFDSTTQAKMRLFKYIAKDLDKSQLSYFNNLSLNASVISDVKLNY